VTVHTLTAKIPSITIVEGLILKLEAVSPTTGAAVSGVSASRWSIYGQGLGLAGDLELGDLDVTWVWSGAAGGAT